MENSTLFFETAMKTRIEKPSAENEFLSLSGMNDLVTAAMPLLLLLVRLKHKVNQLDINYFQEKTIQEIYLFIEKARNLGCEAQLISAARYCLCAAIDEFVLSTEWGNQSSWMQRTMLSHLHHETWGGERFFNILEEMSKSPAKNLDFLELIYIILSLGFEGKYYNQDQTVKDQIRYQLFKKIREQRKSIERYLSPAIGNLEDKNFAQEFNPRKFKLIFKSLLVIIGLIIIFNSISYLSSKDVFKKLREVNESLSKINNVQGIYEN